MLVSAWQAQPIMVEQEKRLWEMGFLGDYIVDVLLKILVFQVAFFFALRTVNEHRRAFSSQSCMNLLVSMYIWCIVRMCWKLIRADSPVTKESQKKFVNTLMSRIPVCALCVYKLYKSKCPQDWPTNAFYLSPLAKPKEDVWYSKNPLGHNTLGKIPPDLMRQAGFEGYYTNHSLRVSLATRLHDAKVDEQLITSRTGHSSTDGVWAYRRTSDQLKQLTSDILTTSPKHILN